MTRDDLLRLIEIGNAGPLNDHSTTADELLLALDGWRARRATRTTLALHGLLALREGVRAHYGDGAAERVELLLPHWEGTLEALVEAAVVLGEGEERHRPS